MSEFDNRESMTPEEIQALEAAREAEREQRIAPFRAIKTRIGMTMRAGVVAGSISAEDIVEQKYAFPLFKPGMDLKPGDVVRDEKGEVWKTVQGHKTQADWSPSPETLALFNKVETDASGELVDPENPPAQPLPWQAGVAYKVGDERTENEIAYTCLQAHTSQAGWEPHAVPAMWKLK